MGITGTLHRYLCGGGIDVIQVAGRKSDGYSSDVFVEPVELCSARDRRHPRLLSQQPGERDLGGGCTLLFRNAGEQVNQGLIRLQSLRGEAWQSGAEIGAVELRVFIHLASEEAAAERAVRN